jgi:uncharacterized protein YndB with AHSA1/START domain
MPGHLTSVEPVRKTVTVPATPERAFELFTAGFHEWWPLPTHSVGLERAVSVTFGAGPGGSIVETLADGTTSTWGIVTDWEPPRRVAFTWHAGTPPAEATRVEVTFTAAGPADTVVRLVHSGWERRPDGATVRDGYESGWDPVVASFVAAAGKAG